MSRIKCDFGRESFVPGVVSETSLCVLMLIPLYYPVKASSGSRRLQKRCCLDSRPGRILCQSPCEKGRFACGRSPAGSLINSSCGCTGARASLRKQRATGQPAEPHSNIESAYCAGNCCCARPDMLVPLSVSIISISLALLVITMSMLAMRLPFESLKIIVPVQSSLTVYVPV